MILEAIGYSMIAASISMGAYHFRNMSDKKKIEKIFDYTKTSIITPQGKQKKPTFIRKQLILNEQNEIVGNEYVYRLPLGMPYKKLEYLNDNIGVFKDGLHKNVDVKWDGGMLHLLVYETQLPKLWNYEIEKLSGWKVPIGKTYKDTIYLDFNATTNFVGGGTARYGKTNLLKVILTSLILNHPEDAEIYLIDLKAGVEFGRYENLYQVKKVASTIEETFELLHEVKTRLDARKTEAKREGWNNIQETKGKSRVFVIVDEAGDIPDEKFMSKQEKDMRQACQFILSHIARIGGAFGFHELFFSQYTTADVLPRQIKQNADSKICFKIQTGYASEVILGEKITQAAELPKIKGRAIYKDGADIMEVQVPYISDNVMNELLSSYFVEDGENEQEETQNLVQFKDVRSNDKRPNKA